MSVQPCHFSKSTGATVPLTVLYSPIWPNVSESELLLCSSECVQVRYLGAWGRLLWKPAGWREQVPSSTMYGGWTWRILWKHSHVTSRLKRFHLAMIHPVEIQAVELYVHKMVLFRWKNLSPFDKWIKGTVQRNLTLVLSYINREVFPIEPLIFYF
jgi:hypothetical protein